MTTRDCAVSVLASLSEEKMPEFIKLFADDNMLARLETEQLLSDDGAKRYDSFKEIMTEIDAENKYALSAQV